MTEDQLRALMNQYTNEINETNRQIAIKEQECADEYKKIEESIPITPSETTVPKGSGYSYTIKNPSGETIKSQNSYQDGTTLEYNGITYTYRDDYGAFVKTREPLCTTENISQYLIPKTILKELNANVITEFQPNVKNEDKEIKEKNYFSTPYIPNDKNPRLKTSKNNELPISRIYNIDHDINKIYFEFNQFWAGNRQPTPNGPQTEAAQGCFPFSLINGCPYETKESYNSQETCDAINDTVSNVLNVFYRKNGIQVTSSNKYEYIASESGIATAHDGSITTTDGLKNIDQTKSYIVHTDSTKYENYGKIASSGTHFVMMVPSGIEGKCYIIDSNNSSVKINNKFTPFMSYDEAIPSIVSGKNHIVDIAIPINYQKNTLSSISSNEGV